MSDATVLVVDDDEFIRDLTSSALRIAGFATTMASGRLDALAAIERDHPDIVVLDVGLPGVDGDALVASGTERLDAAVADGRVDQATADERKETLPERAANRVNGDLDRGLRRHPPGGPAHDRGHDRHLHRRPPWRAARRPDHRRSPRPTTPTPRTS
jgi:CheY-like chemotaxis protein